MRLDLASLDAENLLIDGSGSQLKNVHALPSMIYQTFNIFCDNPRVMANAFNAAGVLMGHL